MIDIPTRYDYELGAMRMGLAGIIAESGFVPPKFTPEIKDEVYICQHQTLPAKLIWDTHKGTFEVQFEGATDTDRENILYELTHQLWLSHISESGSKAYRQIMHEHAKGARIDAVERAERIEEAKAIEGVA